MRSLVATSMQSELMVLRLLFFHEALLKLGVAVMLVIVSIFSFYLSSNS
jgi:hypothetical protein